MNYLSKVNQSLLFDYCGSIAFSYCYYINYKYIRFSSIGIIIIKTLRCFKSVNVKEIRHGIYTDTNSNGISFIEWKRLEV